MVAAKNRAVRPTGMARHNHNNSFHYNTARRWLVRTVSEQNDQVETTCKLNVLLKKFPVE